MKSDIEKEILKTILKDSSIRNIVPYGYETRALWLIDNYYKISPQAFCHDRVNYRDNISSTVVKLMGYPLLTTQYGNSLNEHEMQKLKTILNQIRNAHT